MNVAGIDAHATCLVVAIVSKTGELVQTATRIVNREAWGSLELLERFKLWRRSWRPVRLGRGCTTC
jgi:hypothetical protein